MNREQQKAIWSNRGKFAGARREKARQIKSLQAEAVELSNARVEEQINGTKEKYRKIWEKEKKVHIRLARLQNKKLREGFAES